jgi:multiple sugar transport system permease protein
MFKFLDKLLSNEKFCAAVFVAPSLIGTFLFIVIPSVFSLLISFSKWNLLKTPKFCGFDNYVELFGNPLFYKVLANTLFYSVAISVLGVLIPLILAVIIDKKIKGAEMFKTVYFLPYITPMIIIALVWEWIFDPQRGAMNWLLLNSHIDWLYNSHLAMYALILVSIWKNIGYNMILILTGLQGISPSLYEASRIDGAGEVRTFFRITLPMVSPMLFFVMIITMISSFQVFDLIYLMTNGGPDNSTNVLVFWLYKNAFEYFKAGEASAIAYVLFVIILILSIIQWKLRKKWVFNE